MSIYVSASDVWEYFQKHKEELKEKMHKIAGNSEFGVEIYVTEKAGLPSISVTVDDEEVYEEDAVNESDCEKTVRSIYDDYLTNKVLQTLAGSEDDTSDLDIEDMITEREEELNAAVYDFMSNIMPEEIGALLAVGMDDIIEDVKDHFLEYLARKYKFSIYRPMFLEYEDGTEELSEYPYEDMVFDDEDNPLYKS